MTAPKATEQPAAPPARRRKAPAKPASLMGKAAEVTAPLPRQHAHIGAQLDREFPALATATIPVAPVPEFLTEADRGLPWTHLAKVDQAIEAFWAELDADIERAWQALDEIHRQYQPLPPVVTHHMADETLAWVPGEAVQEQPEPGTGPYPWLDHIEQELAPEALPALAAQDGGEVSDDTAEWALSLLPPVAPETAGEDPDPS
jgi:hypothetical protein